MDIPENVRTALMDLDAKIVALIGERTHTLRFEFEIQRRVPSNSYDVTPPYQQEGGIYLGVDGFGGGLNTDSEETALGWIREQLAQDTVRDARVDLVVAALADVPREEIWPVLRAAETRAMKISP